jgi:ribosomal protein S12 methylthiotransferase accessory factor
MPPVENLPLTKDSLFSVDWPFYWVVGWDLLSQAEVLVPMAMVGMARASMVGSLRSFQVSSNGLGAGNSFLEAVTSALYEVIERDGFACHFQAALQHHRPISVVPEDYLRAYPKLNHILEKCDRAKVGVVVQDCSIERNLPIYHAYVFDTEDRGVPVTKGSGAHLDPEIAILRSVTEALQGRLNFIAGSRDDMFRQAFVRARAGWADSVRSLQEIRKHSPDSRPIDAPDTTDTFEGDIWLLLDSIRHAGFSNVVLFDLTPEGFDVSLVRVVVPGYEGYMHHGYHPGRRAQAFHEQNAAA